MPLVWLHRRIGRKLRIFNDKKAHHFEKNEGQLRQLMLNEIALNEKKYATFVWLRWRHNQTSQSLPIPQPRPQDHFVFQNGVVRFFCVVSETSFIVSRSDCRSWPICQHNKTFLSLHINTYRRHSSPSGMQNICHIKLRSLECEMLWDEVAEWLRRWTANPMCSACVGSNPILVVGSRRDSSLFSFLAQRSSLSSVEASMNNPHRFLFRQFKTLLTYFGALRYASRKCDNFPPVSRRPSPHLTN